MNKQDLITLLQRSKLEDVMIRHKGKTLPINIVYESCSKLVLTTAIALNIPNQKVGDDE